MKKFVEFANVTGLLTCLGKGAIESQPYLSEVLAYQDNLG